MRKMEKTTEISDNRQMGTQTSGGRRLTGSLMLLAGSFIWGNAFVAQTKGAENVPPFTFNAIRSAIAVLFLLLMVGVRGLFVRNGRIKIRKSPRKELLIGGTLVGAALTLASFFQQLGITIYPSTAATSGRSGFITSTYEIMVAVISFCIAKRRHEPTNPVTMAAVGVSVLGLYFLCLSGGLDNLYLGDLMVLVSAVFFTVQILLVSYYSYLDGILLSLLEFASCTLFSAVLALFFETPDWTLVRQAVLPLLYLGIMSSGIGYTLQILGQQRTDPTLASIIMCLESVFAALSGWVLLGERLSGREILGCALMFSAVVLAQIPPRKVKTGL